MSAAASAAPAAAGLISQGVQTGLNTGTSLFNTLMQWFANKRNIASTEKTNLENRQFAAQMSELEWRRFRQQWQDENAYNSPAAQMQRYIAAGLNPNLIYGQAPSIPSSSPSVPSPNVTSSQSPLMSPIQSDLGNSLLNQRYVEAQISRLETQNKNDTRMTDSQINRFAVENNLTYKQAALCEAEAETQMATASKIRQEEANLKEQFAILSEQKKQELFQSAFIAATQDSRIAAENERNAAIQQTAVALAAAQLLNVKADTALKWAQTANTKQDTKLKKAQVRLTDAEMAVARNQAQYLISATQYTDSQKQSLMVQMARQVNYNEHWFGHEGEGKFWHGLHYLTSEIEALGQFMGHLPVVGGFKLGN